MEGVRLAGANLRGVTGLDNVLVKSIDIGENKPIRLETDEARAWLLRMASGYE
jgi:hypothetical protein